MEEPQVTIAEIRAIAERHELPKRLYGDHDVAAALLRLEQERQADIVRISHVAGALRVMVASANELTFDVVLGPEHNYDQTIRDVCRVAPILARYDADLAEAYDDGGRTQPRDLDLVGIRQFTQRYQHRLSNCQIDFGGFPQEG